MTGTYSVLENDRCFKPYKGVSSNNQKTNQDYWVSPVSNPIREYLQMTLKMTA